MKVFIAILASMGLTCLWCFVAGFVWGAFVDDNNSGKKSVTSLSIIGIFIVGMFGILIMLPSAICGNNWTVLAIVLNLIGTRLLDKFQVLKKIAKFGKWFFWNALPD